MLFHQIPRFPLLLPLLAGGLGCASKPPLPTQTTATTGAVLEGAAPHPAPAPPLALKEPTAGGQAAERAPGLRALEVELARGAAALGKEKPAAYFIQYEVHDRHDVGIAARNGALLASSRRHSRVVDTDVRVGDRTLDSTHPVRSRGFDPSVFGGLAVALPLEDDEAALRAVMWRETERHYKAAAERYAQVKTRRSVDVEQEDKSDDFSQEKPVVFLEPPTSLEVDVPAWEERARRLSGRFREAPEIQDAVVSLQASAETRWLLNTEGSLIQTARPSARVGVIATARAEDGMVLRRFESFDAKRPDGLPDEARIAAAVDRVIADLRALRKAPLAEPFIGPAILEGRAAAVFFHEIFGHRAEGHRQKDEREGQTFAKKIGERIMPTFISVFDDPRIERFGTTDLNGFYRFDDEAVAAQRAGLVQDGVMKTFLLGRSPTRGFVSSNGHGRRQEGRNVVSRQANLVVQPSLAVSPADLRARLRAEVARQKKPYGLLFKDISGGFTLTTRSGPQAFKVEPLVVYKVYADGRPDELIRGADIVGTPLSSLATLLAAADDYQVFNGFCGAESGFIPVSAVSPSLLVQQIEIERKEASPDKAPILPPPTITGFDFGDLP